VGGQFNGDCSLYRIYVPVPFETGIHHGCEHGISNREDYRYSSCAFYYLAPAARMERADALALGDAASEEAHRFQAEGGSSQLLLRSDFEGVEGTPPQEVAGRLLEKGFSFTARIPEKNAGLRLRALFDAAEGNRAMDLEVDGTPAASWFRAGANPHRRLREEDIEVDPRFTAGKSEVRIRVIARNGRIGECAWTVLAYCAVGGSVPYPVN
jgi:hypothetical protein